MGAGRPPSNEREPEGPVPLSSLIDQAVARLRPPADRPGTDGFLFSGNRHETVPRALLNDFRLTPLERNAWKVFRMLVNDDGVTAFPTYDQLRVYLSSVPCNGKASDETISRALTILRLARWLTLAHEMRDPLHKFVRGNLYVLHDAPLFPSEVIQLDPNYLGLVARSLVHASKAIQRVAAHALQEFTADPQLADRILPSRVQLLVQQLASATPIDPAPDELSSESEVSPVTPPETYLRNPKTDRTVDSTDIYKSIRTVGTVRSPPDVALPEAFGRLREQEQTAALTALSKVPRELQQQVLNEWATRITSSSIRDPARYLFGIVQKAIRGDFNALAHRRPRR